MKNIFLILFISIIPFLGYTQESEIDSLYNLAQNSNDSVKANIYLDIAVAYRTIDPKKALEFANDALGFANKSNFYYIKAESLNILGAIYNVLGEYDRAVSLLQESLRNYEILGYSKGVANSSNSLGVLYFNHHDYENAKKYYQKALNLVDSAEYPVAVGVYKLNIGEVYQATQENNNALKLEREAYEIFEALEDVNGMAYALGVQAKVYLNEGKEAKAIQNTKKTLDLLIESQDFLGAVEYLNFLVGIYITTGNLAAAEENVNSALDLSRQINSLKWKIESFENLSEILYKKGQFRKAFQYKDSADISKSKLLDEEKQKQISNLRIIYETEQKEKENEILRIDKELKQKTIYQQRVLNIVIVSVLVIIIVFAILTFRAKNQKQKANIQLKLQNEEILQQREEIETQAERLKAINTDVIHKNQLIQEKNQNITDSMNYAKSIQTALLPFHTRISAELEDFFIYYQPKDIVSGDFYWFNETENKVFVVVADCTGHGIPGAFMSFIGHDLLNHIINFKNVINPAEILKQLKLSVAHLLRQKQTGNRDGMDISICVWDKKEQKVQFSGANHELIYIQNKQLHQLKGNKTTIGLDHDKKVKDFDVHEIKITNDTCFYLFSDGYVDQFGGLNNKKYMIKNFRELLLRIHMKKMNTQKEIIKETFDEWKKDQEQVDDILVWGFRIFN
ncbi:tetratricopeptide repeat protein [Marivirga arenosa]|uniref:Tetratricopeptide repeat protein n=1 Tax=Marivirga arenosa TaxID=3059076 RepID=A0AA51RDK4_9BACT|nr:tetratricopeptide repeat protein [Marivirga sp. ABR2-2]WMN07310.1 tetratricopeptide repeat protein [Marivirga sp. ABR2-2]